MPIERTNRLHVSHLGAVNRASIKGGRGLQGGLYAITSSGLQRWDGRKWWSCVEQPTSDYLNPAGTIPSPYWKLYQVGGASGGAFSYADGIYSISGAGSGMNGGNNTRSEHLVMLGRKLGGNWELTCKIESVSSAAASAGVMIREDTGDDSKFAAIGTQLRNDLDNGFIPVSAGYWVRIRREGVYWRGWYSASGSTWTEIARFRRYEGGPLRAYGGYTGYVNMTAINWAPCYAIVGLFVCSNDPAAAATATFSNLSLTNLDENVYNPTGSSGRLWVSNNELIRTYSQLPYAYHTSRFRGNSSEKRNADFVGSGSWAPTGTVTLCAHNFVSGLVLFGSFDQYNLSPKYPCAVEVGTTCSTYMNLQDSYYSGNSWVHGCIRVNPSPGYEYYLDGQLYAVKYGGLIYVFGGGTSGRIHRIGQWITVSMNSSYGVPTTPSQANLTAELIHNRANNGSYLSASNPQGLAIWNGMALTAQPWTGSTYRIAQISINDSEASWSEHSMSPGRPYVSYAYVRNCFLVIGSDLFFCGFVDDTATTSGIWRWNGSAWFSLGTFNGVVKDFCEHRGRLVACGTFTTIDGESFNHIAEWDGSSWRSLGEGFSTVSSVTSFYRTPHSGAPRF